MKGDELNDRNLWRSGLVPLPVWRRKGKKYEAKRKGKNPTPVMEKKKKIDEDWVEKSSPRRRVRLLSDSNERETSRKVICVSDDARAGSPEPGSGLSLSVQEIDSIVTFGVRPISERFRKPGVVNL